MMNDPVLRAWSLLLTAPQAEYNGGVRAPGPGYVRQRLAYEQLFVRLLKQLKDPFAGYKLLFDFVF